MLAMSWDLAGILKFGFLHPMQAVALATVAALLLGCRIKPWWAWSVTAGGILALAASTFIIDPPTGGDLIFFWQNGRDVWDGMNPYRSITCVNPPHAFVVYRLFAFLPLPQVVVLWAALNVGGFALLIVAAQVALKKGRQFHVSPFLRFGEEGVRVRELSAHRECPPSPQPLSSGTPRDGGDLILPAGDTAEPDNWCLSAPALGVLTAAVALSVSTRYCVWEGQLSLFIALALCGALWAKHGGRRLLAGAALAPAAIKTATMLPFLLLFSRRTDRRAWLALAVVGLGMYFAANPALELPGRVGDCLSNIHLLSTPGHMNNFAHPVNADMIGLDRAIYYLRVSDRALVRAAQWAVLLLLGVWVAWRIRGRNALEEPAACCLVAFYAALFLYHRLYDMTILCLPLVYAAGRARIESGAARWLYVGCAASVLGVLYLRLETIKYLGYHPGVGPVRGFLDALVIPSAVWLIFAGMACLATAERLRGRREADRKEEPIPPPVRRSGSGLFGRSMAGSI